MKSNKFKFATVSLLMLFAFLLHICTAFAQTNSVKISYALQGAGFDIYKVADIDANGQFVVNDTFKSYSVSLDDSNAPQTLATYVARDKVSPVATVTTDSNNQAVFTNIGTGVYLITGTSKQKGATVYTASPALIAVNGEDVEISPKYSIRTISGSSSGGGGGSSSGSSEKTTTTVSVSVLKVWKGAEESEKTPVTVQLLKDGEVYSEAILKSTNNWRYTWKNLNRSNDWTVAEKTVPEGYDVSIEENGSVFVITNTNKNYVETTKATTTEQTTTEDTTEVTTLVSDGEPNEDGDFSDNSGNGGDGGSGSSSTGSDNISDDETVPDDESMWGDDDRYRTGRDPNARDTEGDGDDDTSSGRQTFVSSKNTGGKLPQTGQLWWPVPILAIVGDLFLIIGEDKRRKNREN